MTLCIALHFESFPFNVKLFDAAKEKETRHLSLDFSQLLNIMTYQSVYLMVKALVTGQVQVRIPIRYGSV